MQESRPPEHDSFQNVDKLDELKDRLQEADSVEDLSYILGDYISWGNNKISKKIGIFNINSATDCPNRETDRCQVDFEDCYANVSENVYGTPLDYRRRQEYLWESLSAEEWAGAFKCLIGRKRNSVDALRFSEAGDFRHEQDIRKVDRIATMLSTEGIHVYTYSASSHLDWSDRDNFVLNASNEDIPSADRMYTAVETVDDIPDDGVWCPHDAAKSNGMDAKDAPKCGDCTYCVDESVEEDVYITLH